MGCSVLADITVYYCLLLFFTIATLVPTLCNALKATLYGGFGHMHVTFNMVPP